MSDLLLGIDVGTYSSKGVLVQTDGSIVKTHTVEHDMSIPRAGWAEQDANEIWWSDVVTICNALLDDDNIQSSDIRGTAFSAIGPCMLPIDDEGNPIRPGILYGVDARASDEIDWLNEHYGEETIFEFSGMALTSQAVGPKILWMRRNEPDKWNRVAYVMTASSYIVYKMTGEIVMNYHEGSHYMPLIDMEKLQWSDRFSEHIIDIDKLPRLMWSDEIAGKITPEAAKATGLKAGTPVAVGAVDALSEAISIGAVQTGDMMNMYGSTAFFIVVLDEPVHDRRVWSVAGAFEGQYNLAAGMSTTGSLTRWFRDELAAGTDYDELFARAQDISPGAEGLVMLPYFSGERTPINDPDARGVIAGLTLSHSRDHIYRAVLESVACGIRHNLETFDTIGASIKRIIAVGGGTKTDTWLKIVSDVANREQIIPQRTIGASYGDAFLAGLAAGLFHRDRLKDWVQIDKIIEPDESNRTIYETLYSTYKDLYNQTANIVHTLNDLGDEDRR
jgi:xylulokinase